MGNRATCPVCGSHSSSVLYWIESGYDCKNCGCSNILLKEYQEILERKERYNIIDIEKKLIEENEMLVKENFYLKSKFDKLTQILGYEFDSKIVNDLQKAIKILNE